MSSARSVAKELVRLSMSGLFPDPPTHYRLQCLLYFAQAWSLVLRDSELFPDDIKALPEGPVVPDKLLQGDGPSWYLVEANTLENEPDLDQEDEALFVRHLWLAYSYLSNTGMYTSIQEDPPFLKSTMEREGSGAGLIDTADLRESFSRRPGMPGSLQMYAQLRKQQERDAEVAILGGPPLDTSAIWKNCRSVTPSAAVK